MAYGATICTVHVEMNRNQLDNIFARLKPTLVLYQDGLQLDDLLATVSAPRLRLGRLDAPAADTFFAEVARCAPSDAQTGAGPDDDAVILFTSGTSARPKGVVLNFREHLSNIDPTADGFGITATDRLYDFRSFNWASAQLLGALVPVNRGATLVMAQKFSASRFFPHLREHRVTVAAGNPTTINILLNGDADGASRHPARFALHHLELSAAHGRGMAAVRAAFRHPDRARLWPERDRLDRRDPGRAAPTWHRRAAARLSRPRDRRRQRPPAPSRRDRPGRDRRSCRLTTTAISPTTAACQSTCRGRMRTGDLGLIDEDGFLRLTGREKDLIIRGGVNISPVEIDSFLMQRPEVIEVATVGVPDAVYGEEVVSYVVARPGVAIDEAALLRYCSDGLPAFKAPKRIVLAASLPKTERGKLDRRALAERWRRNEEVCMTSAAA